MRGGGQLAVSLAATLIATGLFAVLRPSDRPTASGPALTSGGKLDARIAGAALDTAVQPSAPRLSIVDWAITPANPTQIVADIAWRQPAAWGAFAKPAVETHALRHPRRPAIAAAMPAPPPAEPAKVAAVSAGAAAEPRGGLLASAGGVAQSVASTTRDAVEAAGSGVVRLGAAAVERLAFLFP